MTEAENRDSAPPRSRAARRSVILDLLATQQSLTVAGTAEFLGVSEATVCRDFHELDERQLATRNHGGVAASAVAYELPYRYRGSAADEDLARVAAVTASLLKRADRVNGLNGGTTTTATARAVAATPREPRDGPLPS